MLHAIEYHRFVLEEIPRLADETILDCGCGLGIWGCLMRSRRVSHIYMVGLDIHRPFLTFCKKCRIYDELVLADAKSLPFKDKSFNIILAIKLVEHLCKEEGESFLDDVERICRGIAIVTTPNGFLPQEAPKYTPSQAHKSGWKVRDFKMRGCKVHGIGLRSARLYSYTSRFPHFHGALRYVFTPLTYLLPQLAELLVAVKILQGTQIEERLSRRAKQDLGRLIWNSFE